MPSGSQSGIRFHRGVKKLEFNKAIIDESIDFPEDCKFKNLKEEKRFVKRITDDVTRFDEKVAHSTEKIYSSATSKIATWLLREREQKDEKALSVFSPDEKIGNLKTALIQCNFTDISRLVTDLRHTFFDGLDENREVSDMVVTGNDAIHTIIDRISTVKSGLFIMIIRQFESLRPKFLDSLITLIYSNPSCRSAIPRLRLVVCVSTSPTFFTQTCSTNTLNLMKLERFKFTKLEDVFSKIISTGIHAHYLPQRAKAKSVEEDNPQLLINFDVAPAIFSGAFLEYLRNRFTACDYSVNALIRAIQFALLQKYLKDPLWFEETHEEELKKYDQVLKIYATELCEMREINDELNLHCAIQSNVDYWTKMRDEAVFRERRQFLTEGTSKTVLLEFCQNIREKMDGYDEKWIRKLEELMKNLEEATIEISPEKKPETVETPVVKKKMSTMMLIQQQKAKVMAKKQNPIRTAKSALFAHIMYLFESTLKPYPSTWRNVIGKPESTKKGVKTSLDASDEYDIEKCLLSNPNHSTKPISIAWRSLLCHRNFKSVPINDWAAEFLKNVKMSRKEAKGAFFAAAGQLEHIGLIRGSADKKSTNVNVLYHPISFIPDI